MATILRMLMSVTVCVLAAPSTQAGFLLSTDRTTDQLVRIDTATGGVVVIGALGFDALDLDLVTVGNRLYALNSANGVRVDLHEINPLTGASLSAVQVQRAGGAVIIAEGLGRVGNQLVIGFDGTGSATPGFSGTLGDLGTNGIITNLRTATSTYTIPGFEDLDSLGVDEATGQLFGTDTNLFGRPNDTVFYTVTPSPLSRSVFYTNTAGLAIDDIVVQGGTLFAIADQLHTLDLSTNTFSTTVLDRAGDYSGLALAPSASATPAPASVLLLGTAGLMLGAARRWRRVV